MDGLLFLEKDTAAPCRIEPIEPAEAARRLFRVASVPWFDAEVLPRCMDFCNDLVGAVPAFVFHFTPDHEAVNALMAHASRS